MVLVFAMGVEIETLVIADQDGGRLRALPNAFFFLLDGWLIVITDGPLQLFLELEDVRGRQYWMAGLLLRFIEQAYILLRSIEVQPADGLPIVIIE